MNSSRMNRLEELGRVDSDKAFSKKGKRNLKSEKKRLTHNLTLISNSFRCLNTLCLKTQNHHHQF